MAALFALEAKAKQQNERLLDSEQNLHTEWRTFFDGESYQTQLIVYSASQRGTKGGQVRLKACDERGVAYG